MKKEILNEVNRTREIMGLGSLLVEKFSLKGESQFKDFIQTYKKRFFDAIEKVRPNLEPDGTYDFDRLVWYLVNKALRKKYGNELLATADNNWKMMAFLLRGGFLSVTKGRINELPVRLKKVGSDLVVLDDGEEIPVNDWVAQMNDFNLNNNGTRQIIDWSYNKGDMETEKRIVAGTRGVNNLYLFSTALTEKTYDSKTEGGTEATVASQGEPIPGGSAFSVLEVIPDAGKMKQLIKQIQNSASKGNVVTNVMINGVASDEPIANVAVWRNNVGDKYSNFTDEQITTNTTGKFTEPKTGNQVLAYLRAQNLGKELEKVGITVDSYNYSVGGDEMRADVIIQTEQPAKDAVSGQKSGTMTLTDEDKAGGEGKIIRIGIKFPEEFKWSVGLDRSAKKSLKNRAEKTIIALGG